MNKLILQKRRRSSPYPTQQRAADNLDCLLNGFFDLCFSTGSKFSIFIININVAVIFIFREGAWLGRDIGDFLATILVIAFREGAGLIRYIRNFLAAIFTIILRKGARLRRDGGNVFATILEP